MIITDVYDQPVELRFSPGSRAVRHRWMGTVMGTGQLRGVDVVYVVWDARWDIRDQETRARPDTVIAASLVPVGGVSWA
jgi:hypothetical protein